MAMMMTVGSRVTQPDNTTVMTSTPGTLDDPDDVGTSSPAPGICPPPQPPPAGTTCLTVPHIQCRHPSRTKPCQLVEYRIPLEKGRPVAVMDNEYFIPPGSSADPGILLRPASPTTPFEFPFQMAEETYCDFTMLGGQPQPLLRDSVTRVVGFM